MLRGLQGQEWMRSMANDGSGCSYRGEGGLKCAVGHLIPDDVEEELDELAIGEYEAAIHFLESPEDFYEETEEGGRIDFLSDCQAAHDRSPTRWDMIIRFKNLARDYGLEWPEDVDSE